MTYLIPPHGGYRELKSFQMSELVYDGTVAFCGRFIDRRSRTHDQMVQAARSGKQNITEGCMASGTSKKMELKLIGVARASLEELLQDLEDFLRQRGLPKWGKDDPMAKKIRRLAYEVNRSYTTYKTYIENSPPEVAANTLLCLVHQTNFLLDQQLRRLERDFLEQGGFTERLYRVRNQVREDRSDKTYTTYSYWGQHDILQQPLTAFFCSHRCPGPLVAKAYDLAQKWRLEGRPLIGGFHSPVEQEILRNMLRSQAPVCVVLARSLPKRILAEWRRPLDEHRLLLLSPFDARVKRATRETAARRNQVVAVLAKTIFVAHAEPGSATEAFGREMAAAGKTCMTFDDPRTENLKAAGFKTLLL